MNMEPQHLLQEIRSFVSVNKTNSNILERSKSAIILMRSLPCARAAVLEQICDIFQEAVHRHIVEADSQELLGSSEIPDIDPDVYTVIQSIYDTLLGFVNTNPEAWAPIITKWSVYLLGQLSSKYAGQRANKPSSSLNEKLQMWMSCPATQMLMEISAQCFSKLIDTNPQVCVSCLLDSAVKHSPHFDWVVAYIGSYFHKAIIDHLLGCAMNEFQMSTDGDISGLSVTAVRILDYFALQYTEEVKNSILTLFQTSVRQVNKPCLIPFFIHLGSHAPNILNVVAIPFLNELSSDVMVKLYFKLSEWGDIQGNHVASLLSSIIGLIISLKSGTYKAFKFLLAVSQNIQSSDVTVPEAARILDDIQKYSTILIEQVFVQLQKLVWRKHQMSISPEVPVVGNSETSQDIPFLNEIKDHYKDMCDELLQDESQKSLSWHLKLLALVAIYSGAATSVEILNYILTFPGTTHTLSLFIQVHMELQSFFPRVLEQAVEKYLKRIEIKSSPDILKEVQISLENFQKLTELERTIDKDFSGFSVTRCLKRHSTLLVSFLPYPSRPIASVTLDILLSLGFHFAAMSTSEKMKVVRIASSFFLKLLREYNAAFAQKKCDLCYDYLEMLRKHQLLLTMLSHDESCKLFIIRNLMVGAFHQENKWLFTKQGQEKHLKKASAADDTSLFSKNLKPGISSRLPLNTASVFYIGVIGNGRRKETEATELQRPSTNAQYFLQTIFKVCHLDSLGGDIICPPGTSAMPHPSRMKTLSTLSLLLRDCVILDGSFECSGWPDEEMVKYSIERDIKTRNQFDDSEMLWCLLSLVAEVPRVLFSCLSIIHGLFSSVVKYWEQNRQQTTTQSSTHLFASVQIMEILRKAMWLPRPLSLIGEIFHIISPKELYKLLFTTWEFLKENPPNVNTRMTIELAEGHHKDVVKSIFLGNIAELGHLYARFFPVNKT